MISRADIGSARTMLSYLGRALRHYHERQFARQKLKVELSRLKRISTSTMKKYVYDLERSISDAITKEQRILKHQKQEDATHGDIKGRIKELEARLARYFTIHEIRAQRVKLLENALASEKQTKGEQLSLIKKSLDRAMTIYEAAKKDKKHSKQQLEHIKVHLEKIRDKVRQLQKKY